MTAKETTREIVEYMIFPLLNEYDIDLWENIDYIPIADKWISCVKDRRKTGKEIREELVQWILDSIGADDDE